MNIHAAPSDPQHSDNEIKHHLLLESSEEHADVSKEESNGKISNEEIINELKKVRKQNFITQCLVSAMIVLTVTWQLSEFSLVLKIRNGLSNPLGIIGGLLTGGRRRAIDIQEVIKQVSNNNKHVVKNSSVPGLKIPGFDDADEEKE